MADAGAQVRQRRRGVPAAQPDGPLAAPGPGAAGTSSHPGAPASSAARPVRTPLLSRVAALLLAGLAAGVACCFILLFLGSKSPSVTFGRLTPDQGSLSNPSINQVDEFLSSVGFPTAEETADAVREHLPPATAEGNVTTKSAGHFDRAIILMVDALRSDMVFEPAPALGADFAAAAAELQRLGIDRSLDGSLLRPAGSPAAPPPLDDDTAQASITATLCPKGLTTVSAAALTAGGRATAPDAFDWAAAEALSIRRHREAGLQADLQAGREVPGNEIHPFDFTRRLIRAGRALPFRAFAHSPTVTMPRIKAIVSGTIPSFMDLVYNLLPMGGDAGAPDPADGGAPASSRGSEAFAYDTLMARLRQAGKRLAFYGDDTWLRLFPGSFDRFEGTTSFFVSDTVEVDRNVTRHLDAEFSPSTDPWDLLVLHYLGLDHAGHLEGPRSPSLMPQKQREMDLVLARVCRGAREADTRDGKRTVVVLLSDHGMNEIGNHGGASEGERSAIALFVAPSTEHPLPRDVAYWTGSPEGTVCRRTRRPEFDRERDSIPPTMDQIDLAASLAALLGVPVPADNVGRVVPSLARLPVPPVSTLDGQLAMSLASAQHFASNAQQLARLWFWSPGGAVAAGAVPPPVAPARRQQVPIGSPLAYLLSLVEQFTGRKLAYGRPRAPPAAPGPGPDQSTDPTALDALVSAVSLHRECLGNLQAGLGLKDQASEARQALAMSALAHCDAATVAYDSFLNAAHLALVRQATSRTTDFTKLMYLACCLLAVAYFALHAALFPRANFAFTSARSIFTVLPARAVILAGICWGGFLLLDRLRPESPLRPAALIIPVGLVLEPHLRQGMLSTGDRRMVELPLALVAFLGYEAASLTKRLARLTDRPTASPWWGYLALLLVVAQPLTFLSSSFVEEEHFVWLYGLSSVLLLLAWRDASKSFDASSWTLGRLARLLWPALLARLLYIWNPMGFLEYAVSGPVRRFFDDQTGGLLRPVLADLLLVLAVGWGPARTRPGPGQAALGLGSALGALPVVLHRSRLLAAPGPLADLLARGFYLVYLPGLAVAAWLAWITRRGPTGRGAHLALVRLVFLHTVLLSRSHQAALLLVIVELGLYLAEAAPLPGTMAASPRADLLGVARHLGPLAVRLVLARAAFFALGNTNSIGTIDFGGAYTGLPGFYPPVVGALSAVALFAGPLLAVLAAGTPAAGAPPGGGPSFGLAWVGLVCWPAGWALVSATIMRGHLFIWTVFAPLLIYQAGWLLALLPIGLLGLASA
ncbi:hypothetical protein H696_03960 [Fonticula alba]|uniref:GPI ethanolamine phosphate transferase 2 C-terminal domain-containing protein n=1 Tax=Fonticula alba TaxID=691883 RepID=A0A058Z5M0_FONAL|nr:hypothetical protein H696_03960 [Fonticula alba]KCV69540.1 hypothetical protein H696_03960 [Fonticula alba]|eukprot:XP_009496105.1 hypothetical protein H696_03960 [Fonticula alba]